MGLPKRRMTTSAQVRSMMNTTAAAETPLSLAETRSIDFAMVRSTDDITLCSVLTCIASGIS